MVPGLFNDAPQVRGNIQAIKVASLFEMGKKIFIPTKTIKNMDIRLVRVWYYYLNPFRIYRGVSVLLGQSVGPIFGYALDNVYAGLIFYLLQLNVNIENKVFFTYAFDVVGNDYDFFVSRPYEIPIYIKHIILKGST